MIKPVEVKQPKLEERRTFLGRVGNAIDEAIYTIAPVWGTRRLSARKMRRLMDSSIQQLNRSWDSAKNDRLRGSKWLASGLSADAGLDEDLSDMQDNCAQLYRNSEIAHSAVEARVSNEVGTGITLNSRVKLGDSDADKATAKIIRERTNDLCRRWSEHGVDTRRRASISQVQKLACRTFAVYGEAFILLGVMPTNGPVPLSVDVIAPERVETPPEFQGDKNVRLGIRYSETNEESGTQGGQILGYYVRDNHPGDTGVWAADGPTYSYYEKIDENGQPRMLHVFDEMFPGQSRGIPWLAAAAGRIQDLGDYFEAELVTKQIEACFSLIFKGGDNAPSPQDAANANKTTTDSDGRRLEDIYPGMIHYASDGEEVETVDPKRPGNSFAPFIEQALRSIAGALNLPYEVLAKNFFRTTFSSGQLAMLDGRLAFRMRQKVLIEQFLQPMHRRFIYEAIFVGEFEGLVTAADYLQSPQTYEAHEWRGQSWGFINPKDDVRARNDAVKGKIATRTGVYSEQGEDFADKEDEREEEELRLLQTDINVRKARWDLEEQHGLPHLDEQGASQPGDEEPDDEPTTVDEREDRAEENEDADLASTV